MRYAAIFFLLLQFLHAAEAPLGWVAAASKTENASLSALCHSIHVRAHQIRTRLTGKVPVGGITGSEFLLMHEGGATIENSFATPVGGISHCILYTDGKDFVMHADYP
jgi:hypothetical protein